MPAGWAEATSSDRAAATAALPGLLTAGDPAGFGAPAFRVSAGPGGDGTTTVTETRVGPGERAFALAQWRASTLVPPSGGDPAAHARFASGADRAAVAGLGPGRALLGATSAELRRLGPGDTVELAGGVTVIVGGVVSDNAVGGAELALDLATGERAGLATDRYVLAAYDGGADRAAVEQRLRGATDEGTAVRFRGPGETPFLRNGDAVLPQALIKQRFGEFAYRSGANTTDPDAFEQDARWQAENLVTVDLPIIGPARCHRAVVEALAGALGEVVEANLAGLVDPEGFAGCWNPRTTRAGNAVSRHAWGVAIDLNVGANPTGLASVQSPRLVAIFGRWGFTEGSGWLAPDAGHFEYVSPPRP